MKDSYWGVGSLVLCLVLAGCGSSGASSGIHSPEPAASTPPPSTSPGDTPPSGASSSGTPPSTSSGSGGTGSTPPTSSGATSTPPPTAGKDDQPPTGVAPGPADPRGQLSADCAALNTCTLSVENEGPFTDPLVTADGWQSAQYARLGDGRNCILFSFSGLSTFDNSVRCLDPATGKFTYVTKNTESNKDYVDGNGIIARDNQMMLAIPSVGVLVHGGAYWNATRASNWDGFFDYKLMKWTYISNIYDLFVPPDGFLTDGDGGRDNWSAMNPAVAWSEQDNVGFVYGGDNHAGGAGNYITLVHPRTDGRFDLQPITPPADTMSCTFLRNSAVAVGDWAYVVGGRCAPDSTHSKVYDSAAFRRFNLVTHKWQMLDSLPDNLRMPVVTYDSHSGYIVVYSGNGNGTDGEDQGSRGYWVGHNSVYIWNVATQGPWIDITSLANMPAMFQAAGAYDPVTGWHCYRPGRLFDANGTEITNTVQKSQAWCMRLDFVPKN